nr:hypothetical protein BaRGS_011479 [Batillaria attramentaria]
MPIITLANWAKLTKFVLFDNQLTDIPDGTFDVLPELKLLGQIESIMKGLLAVAAVAAMLVTSSQGQGVDMTIVEEAKGAQVVESVVARIKARCIFSNDRLFLRRVAYVVSRDGTDPATYRQNFHGGIWQVDEAMFDGTQDGTSTYVNTAISTIDSALGIDWSTVTWYDLRKPLYSGLAAALASIKRLGYYSMPGGVNPQSQMFGWLYPSYSNSTFINGAEDATAFDCRDKMDLVFILDSSGSVSYTDFDLMLHFAADIVDVMNVSSEVVRVADVVYSNTVQVEFDFDDYTDADDLKSRLLNTYKLDSTTNTHLALDEAAAILNDTARGARLGVKKVAVLVTDGRSNDYSSTLASAQGLKDQGVTVFAIGVGNYNLDEIEAAASEPTCSHVFTLPGFTFIRSILKEIQKSTCEASLVFTENTPGTGQIQEGDTEGTRTQTKVPGENKTIEANVTCGILNIFLSTSDPNPNTAVYDNRYTVLDGSPVQITITDSMVPGSTLYITVVGTMLSPTAWEQQGCTVAFWTLSVVEKKKDVVVICIEDDVERPCTRADIIKAGLCDGGAEESVDNPCTVESLEAGLMRFPYPYDDTRFIQCDMTGNMYVTSCPDGRPFNTDTLECGFLSPGVGGAGNSAGDVQPFPSDNPCTAQALANHQFYFTYDADKTKYIQCDEWGKAWIKPCAPTTVWSQADYTCITPAQPSSSSFPSTFVAMCNTAGDFIPHPCNHQVFYHCDAALYPQEMGRFGTREITVIGEI